MAVISLSSKVLVHKLFGVELGDALALAAGSGEVKDYRGVLEVSSPTTQCDNTGHKFVDNMPCYLCGVPIPPKSTLKGPSDELWPECEHVLPVTEARWFLDLYMSKIGISQDDWTRKALALEYDQAHRVCNQAKSNFSFVLQKQDGGLEVSEAEIVSIFKVIFKRAKSDVGDYPVGSASASYMQAIVQNVRKGGPGLNARIESIKSRTREIIAHISRPGGSEEAGLMVLARTSGLVDPNRLSPATRKTYDAWYSRGEVFNETRERVMLEVQKVITQEQPYISYPAIMDIAFPNTIPAFQLIHPHVYYGSVSQVLINSILGKFFQDAPKVSEQFTTASLLQYVLYVVYMSVFQNFCLVEGPKSTGGNAIAIRRFTCEIFGRMELLSSVDGGAPVKLYGAPAIPPEIAAMCNVAPEVVDARAQRAVLRETAKINGVEGGGEADEQVSVEEDTKYFFEGLSDAIGRILVRNGIPEVYAVAFLASVLPRARERFAKIIEESQGFNGGRAVVSSEFDGMILLTYGFDARALELAQQVSDLILEWKRDQESSDIPPPVTTAPYPSWMGGPATMPAPAGSLSLGFKGGSRRALYAKNIRSTYRKPRSTRKQ